MGEDYNGTMTIDGTLALNMTNNPVVDYYDAETKKLRPEGAPIFQSSGQTPEEVGTCYSDGATGCYKSPGVYADQNCFTGDYVTLYYLGMGILLEYYH